MEYAKVICCASWGLTQWFIPAWSSRVVPCLGSCLAGTVGGVVSNIITSRRRSNQNLPPPIPPAGWKHGLPGDMILGIAIGLVTFWGGIADVPVSKILLASLVGGVSGAEYFRQRKDVKEARSQARTEKSRSAVLRKTTEAALTPSRKAKTNAEK